MKKMHHKVAGGLLAVGLFAAMAGAAPMPAGASSLNLLKTTTAVVANDSFTGPSSLTATVSLELVKGVLITPSGSVSFSGTSSDGSTVYALGSGTLTRCVLGLPSLLGLWDETCTATDVPNATEQGLLDCTNMSITAYYSAAADLVAAPSYGYTTSSATC